MQDKPTYEELEQKLKDLEKEIIRREQTEEALRANEERLTFALQATSDGIWDWDIKKGQTYASARCGEIFGIADDAESQTSGTWASRIHPDDFDRMSKCLQEHLKGNAPYEVEYRHRHGDETYHWQYSRGMALFDEKGNPYRMVGSIRDITKRKKAEEDAARLMAQLQQAQKMEALGTLAGGVAHDFNNLLTAILGNIELSCVHAKSEEKISKSLLKAKEACRRAKDLVRQFLTFSKSNICEKKIGSVAKLIRDSAKLAITGTQTRCEFFISHDLSYVDFNAEQIRQVIRNFVINASEAMDQKGTICIRAENVDHNSKNSSKQSDGKQVKISIQDHGQGISKEAREKIFDPYFSSKEDFTQKGMGLGLSICYSVIKNHNGSIEVESEIGSGTTIHIYLPAVKSPPLSEMPGESIDNKSASDHSIQQATLMNS